MSEPDFWDSQEARDWRDLHNSELLPMIEGSAVTMGLISDTKPDAKQAVEIGFSLLLDKPIILGVVPGAKVPAKLAAVADEIIEIDLSDPPRTQAAIRAAMERMGLD